MSDLHPLLASYTLPPRMRNLPLSEGVPIPWYAPQPEGAIPDFRSVDPEKAAISAAEHRCGICGCKLGRNVVFTVDPVMAIYRLTHTLPSHLDCAVFAARALTLPILSGPVVVWPTREAEWDEEEVDGKRLLTFRFGEPSEPVSWYRFGQRATRDQAIDACTTALPGMVSAAKEIGIDRERWLQAAVLEFLRRHLPH